MQVNGDLTAMTSRNDEHSIVVIMDRKEAQNRVYKNVRETLPEHRARVGIWNGDKHWPARAASSVNYTTPQSLLHRILIADSANDVQHYQYDEFHDLSHWGILLLSYHLHLLHEGILIWVYLITATEDTALARAVLSAAQQRSVLGTITLGPEPPTRILVPSAADSSVRIPTLDDAQSWASPKDLTEELPDSRLPSNFYDLRWEKQAVLCALAIKDWANSCQESACVLVLVAGG